MKFYLTIFALILLGCSPGDYATLQGPPGPQGPIGNPGSSVTMVQFCSNYSTTYPSTFPEYGFCVSNNLYATYWNGTDAWTAEIVPGYYDSTSTSAPCSFTVLPNCVVEN
jgi:hypothetical protein